MLKCVAFCGDIVRALPKSPTHRGIFWCSFGVSSPLALCATAAPVNGRCLELNLIMTGLVMTELVMTELVMTESAREQDSARNPVFEPIVRARKKNRKNLTNLSVKVKNMFPAGWPSFSAKAQKCKSLRLLR